MQNTERIYILISTDTKTTRQQYVVQRNIPCSFSFV